MKNPLNSNSKVSLVGAGPGDPELLTLKAVKALNNADAVLYDALVNPAILEYAPQAIKLFVGKRKGCHAYTQDQINQLLVEYSQKYGHVVRLKGGDPFVFGRGSEEQSYVNQFGIPCEVVPGISSALAVAATKNIPLTHRKLAQSFWVLTATTSDTTLSKDIQLAARSTATVVILMGMSKLSQIVSLFKNEGKAELPISIIQNGTCEHEKSCTGTIATIETLVRKHNLGAPAIIIIGEVVNIPQQLKHELQTDDFIFQNLGLEAIPA